ncbi:LysM peptidoglycan-binding domain-containing protein [Pedobacter sp. P351]|uniref:LysM peptidoglycan-binding domain-containing protein n=1 Tax=Pedobacter superstes TaxID=3133441 RepID=UPI00309FA183
MISLFSSSAIAASTRDSIGVENQNGTLIILHKVERRETYYSIGRLYNISPLTIIQINNNVSLKPGITIKVPTQRHFKASSKSAKSSYANSNDGNIVEYKVGRKENLYSIAKRFNTTVEDIKQLNKLGGDNLSIGQIIKVRQGNPGSAPAVAAPIPEPITETEPEPERPKIPSGRLGVSERSERGVAVWIADDNLDGSKMLALHRTAPVGTVIKVTNPMTDRVTYAKVVGKFTENESTRDVIIVLTKATADLLGALDKRFLVTLDYGMPNE